MLLVHNIPVYEKLCETLKQFRKAIVVTFTGGGKSFIADEFINESKLRTLVVCPKRTICDGWRQLNPDVSAVTYNYFAKAPMEELLQYEAVILDEVHHCGSKVWGKRAGELMAKTEGVVIGLTADSVRWSDGAKDVAYTLFDGHIVKGYTLKEAIEQNITQQFKYVCTVIGIEEMAEKYEAQYAKMKAEGKMSKTYLRRVDHALHQLKLDLDAMASVKEVLVHHMPENPKGIVFVDCIASIENGKELITKSFPDVPVFAIHTGQPESVNKEQMTAFSAAESACIVSVDMLGEGIHVDGVNFIVMLRRTQSPTVFFQQLGRATVAGGNTCPVVFDIVGNNRTLKSISARESEVLNLFKRDEKEKAGQVVVESYAVNALDTLKTIEDLLEQFKPWTSEEDALIIEYYPSEGSEVYKRLLGRTKSACSRRAAQLGVRKVRRWSKEEDNILRKYWYSDRTKALKLLPDRTEEACKIRARIIKLAPPDKSWTQKEDDILRKYWLSNKIFALELLAGRTKDACAHRAQVLGIITTKRSHWTNKEDDILRKYWYSNREKALALLSGKSKIACAKRAKILGLKPNILRIPWTAEEDAILYQYWNVNKEKALMLLPGRTKEACEIRARKIGLTTIKTTNA